MSNKDALQAYLSGRGNKEVIQFKGVIPMDRDQFCDEAKGVIEALQKSTENVAKRLKVVQQWQSPPVQVEHYIGQAMMSGTGNLREAQDELEKAIEVQQRCKEAESAMRKGLFKGLESGGIPDFKPQ